MEEELIAQVGLGPLKAEEIALGELLVSQV